MTNYDPNSYDPNMPGPYSAPPAPPTPPRKKRTGRKVLAVLGGLLVLGVVVAQFTPNTEAGDVSPVISQKPTPPPAKPSGETTPKPKVTKPSMTKSQEQAVGAAKDHLSLQAYSRKGLIRQLSLDAGAGFSVADATFGVDHIGANWNDQAARAAEEYLKIMHFSRQGLIEQLESSAVGFTHRQAVYGVSKAGL